MSKKVILIADDEPHILELFRMTLGEDDYDFLEAKNGKEVAVHYEGWLFEN